MTMSGFDQKIEFWRTLASAAVADRKRAKAAKPAPAAPPARSRTPVRFSLDPTEIEIPAVADFLDSTDTAAKIVDAGRMARGEVPIPLAAPSGHAAAILNAAETARSGGRPLQKPTGTAAAILAAGKKRRNEA